LTARDVYAEPLPAGLTCQAITIRLAGFGALSGKAPSCACCIAVKTRGTVGVAFASNGAKTLCVVRFLTDAGKTIAPSRANLADGNLAITVDFEITGLATTLFESTVTGRRHGNNKNKHGQAAQTGL